MKDHPKFFKRANQSGGRFSVGRSLLSAVHKQNIARAQRRRHFCAVYLPVCVVPAVDAWMVVKTGKRRKPFGIFCMDCYTKHILHMSRSTRTEKYERI